MLALGAQTALSWAPAANMAPAHPLPALSRAARPAMLDVSHAGQWIADAAAGLDPVLLPDMNAGAAAGGAVEAAAEDGGWFDSLLVKPFEFAIVSIHGALKGAGIDEAYGPSIILFTLLLKGLTFPLNKQQIESTSKMQAIQPAAKALQEKYRNKDPARLNLELQKLYQDNQVNPLAGCLPSLAQIPIFIGLYRSVLNLAKADKLEESFLWLPSLEGPVSDYTKGVGWLFGDEAQGYAWTGFNPPLGWHDTGAYLVLPVLLVVSQYISTAILTPKTDDPAQQQTQAILKVLPLMIGWFSLNVPSGLGLYWMTNNVVTTLTTVLIKRSVGTPAMAGVGADSAPAPYEPPKAQGFGRQFGEVVTKTDSEGTKVTIKPPGASAPAADRGVVEATVASGETVNAEFTEVSASPASSSSAGGPAGGGGKKKKKRKKKKN